MDYQEPQAGRKEIPRQWGWFLFGNQQSLRGPLGISVDVPSSDRGEAHCTQPGESQTTFSVCTVGNKILMLGLQSHMFPGAFQIMRGEWLVISGWTLEPAHLNSNLSLWQVPLSGSSPLHASISSHDQQE